MLKMPLVVLRLAFHVHFHAGIIMCDKSIKARIASEMMIHILYIARLCHWVALE